MKLRVAILYQTKAPPVVDGIVKPMKEGGYSDSGADIALTLVHNEMEVITPADSPNEQTDLDWVFPDSEMGIETAIFKGANTFWLNTVLYARHPILKFKDRKLLLVGQDPESAQRLDNKFYTNELLREKSFPVPRSILLGLDDESRLTLKFPLVLKPVRGRGSQGVIVVYNKQELNNGLKNIIFSKIFGNRLMVEEFLPGREITISIMPPGKYLINGSIENRRSHWALPAVERVNHINEVAPYNGVVAVVNNSRLLSMDELRSREVIEISKKCQMAGKLIGARAPIRIDCRKNNIGEYQLFDLNMKPNMTGASRSHRSDQDSLTMIAARGIGWNYPELIKNIISLRWEL